MLEQKTANVLETEDVLKELPVEELELRLQMEAVNEAAAENYW